VTDDQPPNREPFYTVESLAARLQVTPRTVRNMIRDDEIRSYRIRRSRRFDPKDVELFLAARSEGGA
jgi:excisionase family DNA binding protein